MGVELQMDAVAGVERTTNWFDYPKGTVLSPHSRRASKYFLGMSVSVGLPRRQEAWGENIRFRPLSLTTVLGLRRFGFLGLSRQLLRWLHASPCVAPARAAPARFRQFLGSPISQSANQQTNDTQSATPASQSKISDASAQPDEKCGKTCTVRRSPRPPGGGQNVNGRTPQRPRWSINIVVCHSCPVLLLSRSVSPLRPDRGDACRKAGARAALQKPTSVRVSCAIASRIQMVRTWAFIDS